MITTQLPDTGGAIALPVRAYQMSNSTLWNIRAADGKRLAVELNEMTAKEIEVALNERPKLRDALQRIINRETPVPGLKSEMYGHAAAIAERALAGRERSN